MRGMIAAGSRIGWMMADSALRKPYFNPELKPSMKGTLK
jgi:hypothetical protein